MEVNFKFQWLNIKKKNISQFNILLGQIVESWFSESLMQQTILMEI